MSSRLTHPLVELAGAWSAETRGARLRFAAAVVGLCCIIAFLWARQGTGRARALAAAAMALSVLWVAGWRLRERLRLRDPVRVVKTLAHRTDPERADRALRALSLLGPAGVPLTASGTSEQLAALYVARSLALLPSARIVERAARGAARLRAVSLVIAIIVCAVLFGKFWSVAEGADVLLSRHGVAPLTMRWLVEADVTARPPDYLHENEQHDGALTPLLLPYGTVVTVHGMPSRSGRPLLLSDGKNEVPFVDDGAGAVVARWPLVETTTLRVVARFGQVVIHDPDVLPLQSILDERPVVSLEGAPRQLVLADHNDEDIPLKYEAIDDHGLREVHLVLRSGTREERRVLARLDGETRRDAGGHVLKVRDPFLRKSHAPVEITIEARDNDPLTGPKWGKSPSITLIPPEVGEPEARRLDALRGLRDALVDSLAWRLMTPLPSAALDRASFVSDEKRRRAQDDAKFDTVVGDTYAGVRVPSRSRATLWVQQEKARKAIDAEIKVPSATTRTAAIAATERFVLVLDAVVRGIGVHDTREAARLLADVADDLALGATQLQEDEGDARVRGTARMDAAATVLSGGGRTMVRLGSLGRDLGEIIDSDLSRVTRARRAPDMMHAELAARDLAARLREPDPSFGAKGQSGRAGGESGGARGTPGADEQAGDSGDEVARAQQEAEQDLERLAQEHAGQMGKVEHALAESTSEEEKKAMRDENERHAEAVRDAVRNLPSVGMGSDSWTSKGAAARELAEQMARALQDAHPSDAVQSGRSAIGSLQEASKMLQRGSWFESLDGERRKHVEDARRRLESEEKWAEDELSRMRKRAAERARKDLEQGGQDEERLAERARDLAQRAHDQESLPDPSVESIRDAERAARQAAEALKRGDADRGIERQREAQRALEAARQQLEGDEEDARSSSFKEGDGKQASRAPVNIPDAKEHKGPEEFRGRVVRGLGQPSAGALKEAVRRYAEGLLR